MVEELSPRTSTSRPPTRSSARRWPAPRAWSRRCATRCSPAASGSAPCWRSRPARASARRPSGCCPRPRRSSWSTPTRSSTTTCRRWTTTTCAAGRPTCHVLFGEDTAILAGDALFAEAVRLVAERQPGGAGRAASGCCWSSAGPPGSGGMVGGQYLDLRDAGQRVGRRAAAGARAQDRPPDRRAPCTAPWCSRARRPPVDAALRSFARELGLLFQIVDDILDVEGSEAALGKAVGADARMGKITYVSIHGLEGARRLAGEAHARALRGARRPARAQRGPRGHHRPHLRPPALIPPAARGSGAHAVVWGRFARRTRSIRPPPRQELHRASPPARPRARHGHLPGQEAADQARAALPLHAHARAARDLQPGVSRLRAHPRVRARLPQADVGGGVPARGRGGRRADRQHPGRRADDPQGDRRDRQRDHRAGPLRLHVHQRHAHESRVRAHPADRVTSPSSCTSTACARCTTTPSTATGVFDKATAHMREAIELGYRVCTNTTIYRGVPAEEYVRAVRVPQGDGRRGLHHRRRASTTSR